MQSTKVDVNKQIQIVVKTGKVALGVKEALDAARFAKAKLLIVASNCPAQYKTDIIQYAKQSSVPVFNFPGNSVDLGSACLKPFVVTVLTIKEPGDSEILKLAER
ncbi:MAG: 50S ribosomal protein L30e [Candidatus Bathyarchaeia archaeon]|jgi:large subunit ribosomal protein L30e